VSRLPAALAGDSVAVGLLLFRTIGALSALACGGIIWLSPVVPFRAEDIARLNDALETLLEEFGFDYFVTFSMLSERCLAGVVTIAFDAEDDQETKQALLCHRAASELVVKLGYPPYRVGIDTMPALNAEGQGNYWAVTGRIKAALDPGRITPGDEPNQCKDAPISPARWAVVSLGSAGQSQTHTKHDPCRVKRAVLHCDSTMSRTSNRDQEDGRRHKHKPHRDWRGLWEAPSD
jgi:hypothetical protein